MCGQIRGATYAHTTETQCHFLGKRFANTNDLLQLLLWFCPCVLKVSNELFQKEETWLLLRYFFFYIYFDIFIFLETRRIKWYQSYIFSSIAWSRPIQRKTHVDISTTLFKRLQMHWNSMTGQADAMDLISLIFLRLSFVRNDYGLLSEPEIAHI